MYPSLRRSNHVHVSVTSSRTRVCDVMIYTHLRRKHITMCVTSSCTRVSDVIMNPCQRQAWTRSHQRVWAPTELKAFKVLPVSAHLLREDGESARPEGQETEGQVLVHYLA